VIIYGSRIYGRVDYVPTTLFVGTEFFHLYLLPIVPVKSFIILDGTEGGGSFRGARTRFSFKSILVTCMRAALVLAGIVLFIASFRTGSMLYFYLAPVLLLTAGTPKNWLKASPRRASTLVTQLRCASEEAQAHAPDKVQGLG
jgi:hypothetical protein